MVIKRPRTAKELADHVSELARVFHVELHTDRNATNGHAICLYDAKTKEILGYSIHVYPVVDDMSYAIAMHELGHCCAPNGMIIGSTDIYLEHEYAAWEWAKYHALDWSPAMQHALDTGISSHTLMAEIKKHEEVVKTYSKVKRARLDETRPADLKKFVKKLGL